MIEGGTSTTIHSLHRDTLIEAFFQSLEIEFGKIDPEIAAAELSASIGRVQLRKPQYRVLDRNNPMQVTVGEKGHISNGEFTLYPQDKSIVSPSVNTILSPYQFSFLFAVMSHQGDVAPYADIARSVWNDNCNRQAGLKTLAFFVRRKIDHPGTNILFMGRVYNTHIVASRDVGYRLFACTVA